MRKLSMKGKHRKSEASSDHESDENGVGRNVDNGRTNEEKNESSLFESPLSSKKLSEPALRKRNSKGRSKRKEATEYESEAQDSFAENEQENGSVNKSNGGKRYKKEEKKATAVRQNMNEEYEVEKIVGQRTIKGRRQFLVRWRGYGAEEDTWEQEKDLNCLNLIEEFLMDKEEEEDQDGRNTEEYSTRNKRQSKGDRKSKKLKKAKKTENTEIVGSDSKEYEVEKIIEVRFKKNKNREFLIRWKGFSSNDDTWEPESNLNCPDLISKFMDKVEKAKSADMRELRANPKHTKRYTLTMHGKRQSRRNAAKQRVTYHECDI